MSEELFKRALMVEELGPDAIWAPVPDDVQSKIRAWQALLLLAVPIAKPTEAIQINLVSGLFNFARDLVSIIRVASNATPCFIRLTNLETRRISSTEQAIIVRIESPELHQFQQKLADVVAHPIAVCRFQAWIEIARIQGVDIQGIEMLEAAGVKNATFVVDQICAGLPNSYQECPMLGHEPMRFGATPQNGEPLFEKSARGMSTLSMESGGGIMQDFSIDIDDDDDDDDDDEEDEDNEQTVDTVDSRWLMRAMEFSKYLDSGEY